MRPIEFGCKRFNSLLSDLEDRDLTSREQDFLSEHGSRCTKCLEAQDSMHQSLNMLRAAAFEAEPERAFDRRVIRKVQVQAVKDSFTYWAPAMVGCLLAFIVIFSTLDLLTMRGSQSSVKLPDGQAFRDSAYPRFELSAPPHFAR